MITFGASTMTQATSIALDKLQEQIRAAAKKIAIDEVTAALGTLQASFDAGTFADLGVTNREDYLIWLTRPAAGAILVKRIMAEDPAAGVPTESVWSNCLALAIAEEIGNHARLLLDAPPSGLDTWSAK